VKKTETPHPETGKNRHGDDFNALYDAFLLLKTRDECERFLYDLTTPAEALAFVERWKVARMLDQNKLSYRGIHEKTGVSITTIGRVARFLSQESYLGYRLVLDRLKKSQTH
jgi:TrpR-related protein YerC/YecD